jgi:hypothetical protein
METSRFPLERIQIGKGTTSSRANANHPYRFHSDARERQRARRNLLFIALIPS